MFKLQHRQNYKKTKYELSRHYKILKKDLSLDNKAFSQQEGDIQFKPIFLKKTWISIKGLTFQQIFY
jgi:hypothetical protein